MQNTTQYRGVKISVKYTDMVRMNLGPVPKHLVGFEQVYKGSTHFTILSCRTRDCPLPNHVNFAPNITHHMNRVGSFLKGIQQQPIANTRKLILWDGGENHYPC